VRHASSARRAGGLLAVSTIGLSTAVLSVTGMAQAAGPLEPFTIPATGAPGTTTVPAGYCAVDWILLGAEGGPEFAGMPGEGGGEFRVRTEVEAGLVLDWTPGSPGDPAIDELTPGAGGSGAPGYEGSPGVPNTGGGGGGGATTVTWGPEVIVAVGGAGGGLDGGAGGGDTNSASIGMGFPTIDEVGVHHGPGSVAGTGVPCSAPPAPDIDTITGDEGKATLRFFPPATSYDGEPRRDENGMPYQPLDGTYQYSLNGGTWQTLTITPGTGDALDATIPGLDNGITYGVRVRAGSLVGYGAASTSAQVTPTHVYAAPTNVTATTGANQIRVSWTAPAGETGITGYYVSAYPQLDEDKPQTPPGGGFYGISECTTAGNATTCLLGVQPGVAYGIGVAAFSASSYGYPSDAVITEVVKGLTVPAALPKADGKLTSDDADGKLVAGEKVTISGENFLPGSTVDLIAYSTPVKLGSVTVLSDGTFSAEVTLPKDMENGVHHLVASGVDANGNVKNLVVEVTVSGGTAVLALTGFSALPFVGAGALALLAGGGLLLASRRRQAA
jgi:hypothetical protein